MNKSFNKRIFKCNLDSLKDFLNIKSSSLSRKYVTQEKEITSFHACKTALFIYI